MDDALVSDRGDRDARLAQLVGVGTGTAVVFPEYGLSPEDLTPEQDALAEQLLRLITANVTN